MIFLFFIFLKFIKLIKYISNYKNYSRCMTVYGIGGVYIPILFFKFTINFYEKIGPRGRWIFQKYFKIIILIFWWPCKLYQIYYHFRCTTLYIYIQKYFINYFLNLILLNFLWKTCPRGEMNAPGNLLNLYIYIYMKFRNKNMNIWWMILKIFWNICHY